jgi:Uma2 family endonuclease
MSAAVKEKMSADEFLIWAEAQEGRWELQDGAPVAMSPERVAHVRAKGEVFQSLSAAIVRAGSPCKALLNGAGVRIADGTVFEPDALVYCGPRLPPDAIEVPNPTVVVEVLSASTAARDHGVKLTGYFSLPNVAHYLVLDPERRVLIHHKRGQGDIHHKRGQGDVIETRILTEGVLRLDPPGLEAPVAEMFAAE